MIFLIFCQRIKIKPGLINFYFAVYTWTTRPVENCIRYFQKHIYHHQSKLFFSLTMCTYIYIMASKHQRILFCPGTNSIHKTCMRKKSINSVIILYTYSDLPCVGLWKGIRWWAHGQPGGHNAAYLPANAPHCEMKPNL